MTAINPISIENRQTKSALENLLDMLRGWSDGVQEEETASECLVEKIEDLYQAAGALEISDQPDDENAKKIVRQFVEERVIALLLE
jgi:hypothetical protein